MTSVEQRNGSPSLISQMPAVPASAMLSINGKTGRVLALNDAAFDLLACGRAEAVGEPWWQVLGVAPDSDEALARAITAGVKTTLPPTLINTANGAEQLVGGILMPQTGSVQSLLLWRQLDQVELDFSAQICVGDTVLVLGVDQLRFDQTWDVTSCALLMMDLQFGLLEIVREQDAVAMPTGVSVTILLRDTTEDAAHDISRALLSHLRLIPQQHGKGASNACVRIGLAHRRVSQSSLQTLVGASAALRHMQNSGLLDRIKVAQGRDQGQDVGNTMYLEGAFAGSLFSLKWAGILGQLRALTPQVNTPKLYLREALNLLVSQEGVSMAAFFQRQGPQSAVFIVGATKSKGVCRSITELELPATFSSLRQRLDSGAVDFSMNLHREDDGDLLLTFTPSDDRMGYLYIQAREIAASTSDLEALARLFQHELNKFFPRCVSAASDLDVDQIVDTGASSDKTLEGYVGDNMEGAVDQASFLAKTDMPLAIVGPRGTGKMYIAKIIHRESGGASGMLQLIDCGRLGSREDAARYLAEVLEQSQGKTLVFKSPHLLHASIQNKLARQITTRTVADSSPPRYLPQAKYVALFPASLEQLGRESGLGDKLASAFAGYPIFVPAIKDRKQAVLRWAYKILGQESAQRQCVIQGFTPDAEQAMQVHEWRGNITEMRECIVSALHSTRTDWISPVDLGIYAGISPEGRVTAPLAPFLSAAAEALGQDEAYSPSALEELDIALGQAVTELANSGDEIPLGTWLMDELVLAARERYRGHLRNAALFLHTKPRNLDRWMESIALREGARNSSLIWAGPKRLIGAWILATSPPREPPRQTVHDILIAHLEKACQGEGVSTRASLLGVSIPTYQKRRREMMDRWAVQDTDEQRTNDNGR